MTEDFNMILDIAPNLFNGTTASMGFEYCPNCKKMMWWDNKKDLWNCDDCEVSFK